MLNTYKDILVVEDVMDILKIGRNSAYKLIKDGKLKSKKVGRKIIIPKIYMIDFLVGTDCDADNMYVRYVG